MSALARTLPAQDAASIAMPVVRRNAVLTAGIMLLAFVYQSRWGTIPDTSWLITVCERLLSGERLYVDIYETNPPFSVWLYLPPVALAHMLGVAPEILVQLWAYLAAFAGLLLAGVVVHRARFPEAPALFALMPAFLAMLVLFPGNAFSEREHIGAALFLPLLVLMAWRARTGIVPVPGYGLAALVGLAASVLLLVKPYYAVMVLAPALFVAIRQRSIRPMLAIEHWVIGIVCSLYLGAILVLHPEFVRDVYPVLADTYLKVRVYLPFIVIYGPIFCLLALLIWQLWPAGRSPELAAVMTLAAAAALIPFVGQAKGWAYHAYPGILYAVFSLFCLLALPAIERGAQARGRFLLAARPGWPVVFFAIMVSHVPFWITQKPSSEMIQTVSRATDRPTVAMIGADIATGHPFSRMIGGRWASAYACDWLGVLALGLSQEAKFIGDEAEAARYAGLVANYASKKNEEFRRLNPDIVIIAQNAQGWTDLLIERHGFGELLSNYRLLAQDASVRVMLRKDYRRDLPFAANGLIPAQSPAAASN